MGNQNKGIVSLIALLSIGFFALGLALTSTMGALVEHTKDHQTVSANQSFYTAEAAAEEGLRQYQNNLSYSGGTPQLLNSALNSHISIDALAWPYAKIKGMAENKITSRQIVYTVTVFPEGLAFEQAIFSGNNLSLSGQVTVNGNVFAKNQINLNGVNAKINGDVFSTAEISSNTNILGQINSFVDPVPAPQLNLQPYRDIAMTAHTFFSSTTPAQTFLNNKTQPALVFVDQDTGKTTIQNSNLQGSLVVRNDLDLIGGTYSASSNYLVLIVLGNLKIAGGAQIHGIVYVKGTTSFGSGGGEISGALISINDAELSGNGTVNFSAAAVENWPGLLGLRTTSIAPPKVINWEEK